MRMKRRYDTDPTVEHEHTVWPNHHRPELNIKEKCPIFIIYKIAYEDEYYSDPRVKMCCGVHYAKGSGPHKS